MNYEEKMNRLEMIQSIVLEDCEPNEVYLETYRHLENTETWSSVVNLARNETYQIIRKERTALYGAKQDRVNLDFMNSVFESVSVSHLPHKGKVRSNKKLSNALKSRIGEHDGDHTLNFDCNATQWVQHSLTSTPDPELVSELIGQAVEQTTLMPQILIYEVLVPMSLNQLMNVAAQYPLVACLKGIDVDKKIVVPSTGSTVGALYFMKVTILMDLMLAIRGLISIFSVAPQVYWDLRASLSPRTIGGYAFSFDVTSIPEFSTMLANGRIELALEGYPDITLAWPIGTEDTVGRVVLTNTIPTLNEDDVRDAGVELTEKLFSRLLAVTDTQAVLSAPPPNNPYFKSAAAFAQTQDYSAESYQTFARITSEVPIKSHELWISSLDLAGGTVRRGIHIYNETKGPCTFSWRIIHNDSSNTHYRVVPKQISLSSIITAITAQLIQADVISDSMPTSGPFVQSSTSYVASTDSGTLVEYISAICSKRFAEGATVMAGSEPLNPDTRIIGAGRSYYSSYDVLASLLPIYLTEAFAEMSPFLRKVGSVVLAYVPYLCIRGSKTRANTLENFTMGDTRSVLSLYIKMYPKITTGVFEFGVNSISLASEINFSTPDVSFFTGSGPVDRRLGSADLYARMQGNLDLGPGLANVHHQDYTNLYYSEFLTPMPLLDDWDNTQELQIHSIGNKIPFDPNAIAHCLARVLPQVYTSAEDMTAYVGITQEVVSLKLDDNVLNSKLPFFISPVHPVAGWGSETSISDHAVIEQHTGGGFVDFLKKAGKAALPVVKILAGKLADNFAPGASSATDGLFDAFSGMLGSTGGDAHMARMDLLDRVLSMSGSSPYAPLLCPCTNLEKNRITRVGFNGRPKVLGKKPRRRTFSVRKGKGRG